MYFSQGNLQYVGGEWRFADHQWDYLGDNGQGSATEEVARDLFGWGTSGHSHGAASYQPWSTGQDPQDYYAYGEAGFNLFDETGEADWGVNGIANGGGVEGLWRVPTREEWDYLLHGRTTTSGIRYAKANVNGVRGLILLPDDWETSYHALNSVNDGSVKFTENMVTPSEWESDFESHGAVFLPAAGFRFETNLYYMGTRGSYYSATASGGFHAWNICFDERHVGAVASVTRRSNGQSVRLVTTSTALWYTSVTTGEVTDITSTSATASGTVTTEGGTILTAVGVCWSTETAPTIEGEHTDEGALTGDFTSALTGLQRNTTYYVRAYATDGEGDTIYGDEVSFTTLPEMPAVTTAEVTEIGITAATAGGEVTDDGGTTVDECGVCWSTEATPTIEGDHAAATTPGTGAFTVELAGLTQATTYYVRAYVTNSVGTAYGDEVTFTTLPQPWTVTATAEPAEGGTVSGANTYNEGTECTLTATPNEGYAFVNWTEGGEEVSTEADYTFEVTGAHDLVANFEAVETVPEGAINGQFSINANGMQVLFSQGNLQYIGSASTPYWKFADHQWDCLGDNGQGSDSQTVDRDLFGWGTSGYDHGAVCYQPWSTSESNSDYYVYNNRYSELYSSTGQADWGYNAISNGGNQENSGWRTLTRNEWAYIFDGRNTASGIRFAMGNVNGVDGLILLPDNWDASTYPLNKTNDDYGGFHANTISATVWTTVLEANGAVFLPKTVGREGTTITTNCNYWSSTHSDGNYAYSVYLDSNYFSFGNIVNNRSIGNVVRLVRSLQ